MKKIVFVTDILFWKNNYGSHMRIQALVRFLSQKYDVSVFLLKSVNEDVKNELTAIGLKNVNIVGYKKYSGLRLPFKKDVGKIPFFKKHLVDDFCSAFMAYLNENKVHAVFVEYIRLAYFIDVCPNDVVTILDAHDVMSLRTISLRRAKLQASIEIDMPTERSIMRRFDKVLTISRTDEEDLRSKMLLSNTLYAPYAVARTSRHECNSDGRTLIFIGANSAANVEGLRWFLSQVWPLLAGDGYTLLVVGGVVDAFRSFPPGVVRVGQRDEVADIWQSADIAINPVFVGGGLKIKCVDALSAGLPCVTTAEGAAGLEEACFAGLVVARGRLEFVAAIRHFSGAPEERKIVSELAPRMIEREFVGAAAYSNLSEYLASRSESSEAWS